MLNIEVIVGDGGAEVRLKIHPFTDIKDNKKGILQYIIYCSTAHLMMISIRIIKAKWIYIFTAISPYTVYVLYVICV